MNETAPPAANAAAAWSTREPALRTAQAARRRSALRAAAAACRGLLGGALLLACAAGCGGGDGNGRNVIIFMVDTLRADHLGYHGCERATSPNLDDFALRAAVFLNHHSQASRTGPSVASLFTGLHVRSHGVVNPLDRWDGKGVLAEERLTLAEILAAKGYDCRAIVSNPNVFPRYGFGQGFGSFLQMPMDADAGYINSEAARAVVDAAEGGRPFFLYLHYMDPHSPYSAPAPANKLFTDPSYKGPITGAHQQLDAILRGEMVLDDADLRHLNALYDQEIAHWDNEFGRLMSFLEGRGLLEDTVVLVVADHGEEFLEHGGVLHGYTLYEEQLHVPFAVMASGLGAARVDAATRNIDVLPTVLDLLDIAVPAVVQGESVLPLAAGSSGAAERFVFGEAQMHAVKTVKARSFQARGFKYVETFVPEGREPELYDLAADPGERHNVHGSQSETARRMKDLMAEFLESVPEVEGRSVAMDPQTIEALKRLGYIDEREH